MTPPEFHPTLEGIDQIDWSHTECATGPGDENIPSYLQGLTSSDDSVRQGAFNDLSFQIEHQGSLYDATACCAPFFIRMIESGMPAAPILLEFLSSCLGSYDEVSQRLALFRRLKEAELTKQGYGPFVRIARDIERHTELWVTLFQRGGSCQAYVATLLGIHLNPPTPVRDLMRTAVNDESLDEPVRVALVLGLGLQPEDPKTWECLNQLLTHRLPAIRLAAALARLGQGTKPLDEQAIRTLLMSLRHVKELEPSFNALRWSFNPAYQIKIALTLLKDEPKLLYPIFVELLESLGSCPPGEMFVPVTQPLSPTLAKMGVKPKTYLPEDHPLAVLYPVFNACFLDLKFDPAKPHPIQTAFLQALRETTTIGSFGGALECLLQQFRLPTDRKSLT